MIVVLKPGVCEEKKSQLTDWLAGQGLSVHPALGGSQTILGLVGDTEPSRHVPAGESGDRGQRKARLRPLQMLQPEVPPG